MDNRNFPKAIQKAIGTGVPCARPFPGGSIKLLQRIDHAHVKRVGLFRHNHVLINPGNSADTLITCVDDNYQKVELETLVATADVNGLKPVNVKDLTSLKAGFDASIPLDDLAKVGLKATTDANWSLSLGNGRITKKSVNAPRLRKFLKSNHVPWGCDFKNKKAVVTAIYFVTGGLKFSGDSKLVTTGGLLLDAMPNVPVNCTVGWQFKVNNAGQVILSEINPLDWIIAIECNKVEPDDEEEVKLKGPPVRVWMADEEETVSLKGQGVEEENVSLKGQIVHLGPDEEEKVSRRSVMAYRK
jgi:hypothetical protein